MYIFGKPYTSRVDSISPYNHPKYIYGIDKIGLAIIYINFWFSPPAPRKKRRKTKVKF